MTDHATPDLLPETLPEDPFPILVSFLDEAMSAGLTPNPNSMSLATVTPDGRPRTRIVLCKLVQPGPGHLVFFTNYESDKGYELEANPYAEGCFHWDHRERQIRVSGPITKSPAAENDAYFATRPWLAKVAAWASDQSRPLASRADLDARLSEAMARCGVPPGLGVEEEFAGSIERPPYWGGYRLWVERMEIWMGVRGRLHDRAVWTRDLSKGSDGEFSPSSGWSRTRVQP
jgi:pyridoxamine 5'-phosphate oxidase